MKVIFSLYKHIFLSILWIFPLIILQGCNTANKDVISKLVEIDSIPLWIQQVQDKSIGLEKRKHNLYKAYKLNRLHKIDSIKNANLLTIAYEAYNLNDILLFKKTNLEAQNFSIRLRDTFGIADTHWNYGLYYSKIEIMDSAYYHYSMAYKYYKSLKHDSFAGKMLYGMALVQKGIKDYTGSEVLLFKAISIFKKIDKFESLYLCYNLLGTGSNQMKEYDKAIIYHKKALINLEKVKQQRTYKEASLNNLGFVYQNKGEYKRAIKYFNQALENENLIGQNINLYARLIDNRAYTRFLSGDTTNVLQDYRKSLHIRDSLHYISGLITSKLHLAEWYVENNDTVKAISSTEEAYKLAVDINNNRNVLGALLLLSKIDIKNATNHLMKYATLSDSLQIQERKIRNKFTRIRFETDGYIEETEKLSQQKIIISVSSFMVLLLLLFLFFIRIQRAKTKELIFERDQQKSNEEIYSLLLNQQSKMEEGRMNERNRIAEDLHDGVLGKIFGTRLGLGFLNIKGEKNTLEKHQNFIDELQTIEKEIRTISHELKNELFESNLDFTAILETLLKEQSEVGNFKYKIISEETISWNEIDGEHKINCYRIIQEAIQNINKHANATFVQIDFVLRDQQLTLTIKDNGVGFDIAKKKKGIGFKNMKSRVKKLGGEFSFSSIINKGTNLTISIPI